MTQSSPPGPLDHPEDGPAGSGRLSPWEQRVLDRLEADLTGSDPDFARRMTRRAGPWTALLRVAPFPVALGWLVWLVGALIVLVVAAALMPATGWALLGLITTLVVLPWLLLCAAATRRED
jgi:Protein of unknown function (DUF3040)